MLLFYARVMNETIIAYCMKMFCNRMENLHICILLIFRAAKIVNFYIKYKGGIMSHKAANLESDSIPRGDEPR